MKLNVHYIQLIWWKCTT